MDQVKLAAFNATLAHFGLNKMALEVSMPSLDSVTGHAADFFAPMARAKDHYIAEPLRAAASHVGHGLLNPLEAINDLRTAPRQLTLKNVGNVAGLSALGYGAYRGGKALYNKLTGPSDDPHGYPHEH